MRCHRSVAAAFVPSGLAAAVRFQSSGAWRQRFTPTRFLPKFEIHDVREDPSKGSMTRVSVDGKQLLVTQYPQLGPRKLDPNDPTPQFDISRRISARFRHIDLAAMVCVKLGHLPSHHVKNNAYDLTFEKTPEGGYTLRGQIRRAGPSGPVKEMEAWGLVFDNHFAVALEHFLEASLTESFGFRAFAASKANNNNNNNNNNNSNRNRRNQRGNTTNNNTNNNNRNNNNNNNNNAA